MNLFRSARAAVDMLYFEACGVALRGIVLAASIINGTRPRGMLR